MRNEKQKEKNPDWPFFCPPGGQEFYHLRVALGIRVSLIVY